MDAHGYDVAHAARARPVGADAALPRPHSGYVQRASTSCPKQGARTPWRLHQNYIRDVQLLRRGPLDDSMEFSSRAPRRQPLEQAA